MQISTRFTIAVHALLCVAHFSPERKVTSGFIAQSVGVNPVVIRRTLGQLKEAGLVRVEPGVGGATLARPAEKITLLDVFRAVGSVGGSLFDFHPAPNDSCPVGKNVHAVLDAELGAAQAALEGRLGQTSLADLDARLEDLV
ncbi:MAG TPA: Rrf2 family transcriptional regulator [Candidatus Olsenella pullicola]|nr:Rrf2 family transcriptional regulator [Candidatus Olsenella pullicola]